MSATTSPIPPGHRTVTPHLVIREAAKAIDFYQQAFGARELMRMTCPDTHVIMHAEIQIGDSVVMLNDEFPKMGSLSPHSLNGSPVTVHLYVENADEAFDRAVKAGATVMFPLADMFWGGRFGKVRDPFGHEWSIATHQRDVSPEECMKAAAAFGPPPSK